MRVRIDGHDGRNDARDVARDGRHAPASGSRPPRRPSPHRRGDDAVQVRGFRREVPKKPPPPDAAAARLTRSRRRGRCAPGRNLGPAAADRLLRRPRQQPGQKRPRHVLHGPHDGGAREAPVRARRLKVQRASRAEASLGVRDDPRRWRTSRRRPGVGVGVCVGGRLGLVAFVARMIQIQIQILALRLRQPRGRRPPPRRRQHALHLRNHGRLGVHLDQRPGARHQRPRRALAGDVRSIRRAVAPSSLPLRLGHPGVEQREELYWFALPRLADQDGAVEHRRGR
mmetsp:Transcript_13316/g.56286  ORF Transcript_13316/g.56286 Transcript_13316/m.56286 type:complete len:284 (+) Transcript_13316:425-1276(+)